jgi:hypothetical protein
VTKAITAVIQCAISWSSEILKKQKKYTTQGVSKINHEWESFFSEFFLVSKIFFFSKEKKGYKKERIFIGWVSLQYTSNFN